MGGHAFPPGLWEGYVTPERGPQPSKYIRTILQHLYVPQCPQIFKDDSSGYELKRSPHSYAQVSAPKNLECDFIGK